ncbi:IS1182 family transposase [Weissella paramesenteroides]
MYKQYNTKQLILDIPTAYEPAENHPAYQINELVEHMNFEDLYHTGRYPYHPALLLKLILFAYARGFRSGRQIERFADENKVAMWLTQGAVPSYRTINRFRVNHKIDDMITDMFTQLRERLLALGLIDDVIFIDGTKILADANKYSFVWRKNTVRYSELNQTKAKQLIHEIQQTQDDLPSLKQEDLSLDEMDEVIAHLEARIDDSNEQVHQTLKLSPNPAKQERRHVKSQTHHLQKIKNKQLQYEQQQAIFGTRNSYSKTDHDATFMRVKEDPMLNGQLKPAYNVQMATNGQYILNYDIFQRPTDTKTLIPFLNKMKDEQTLGSYIVADMGYGSEANYRFLEDEMPEQTVLIPYGTMLRENSRKWQSDDRKVMNWEYDEYRDEYTDKNGVLFTFHNYSKRTDKSGITRDFKVYQAESKDENNQIIPEAFTPKQNVRRISINPAWEYQKAKIRDSLNNQTNTEIYARRKIEVEPVFGRMKAHFGVTRFMVRGLEKVKREMGIVMMAMNMAKLSGRMG